MALVAIPQGIVCMIAWITHHLPKQEGEVGGIPGKYRGGAEMSDAAYLDCAPEKVQVFGPSEWQKALDFDKIIITGTDLLTDQAMTKLAAKNPVVLTHHKQDETAARKVLLDSAKVLICRTPKHLELELAWTSPKQSAWALSSLNVTELYPATKKDFALWAARMHHQKGLENAIQWAESQKIPLTIYYNKPRHVVLETMRRAKHFVFLPNSFDAEPRSVIEAVLSGCKVETNDFAGITSVPNWQDADNLRGLVESAGTRFWELALQ